MEYSKIWLNLIFATLNLTFITGQKAFPVFHTDQVIIRLPCSQGQLSRIWKVQCDLLSVEKKMLSSVENAFVGRDEKHALLEMPVWEAKFCMVSCYPLYCRQFSFNWQLVDKKDTLNWSTPFLDLEGGGGGGSQPFLTFKPQLLKSWRSRGGHNGKPS